MLTFLHNIPIKRKLMIIIMGVSLLVLLLVYVVFVIHEVKSFRKSVSRDLDSIASLVGQSCAAGIVFDDDESVTDTLASLSAKPEIAEARVFNRSGDQVATFTRSGKTPTEIVVPPREDGGVWTSDDYRLFSPVALDGEEVGRLYLRCEFGHVEAAAMNYLLLAALVGVATAVLAGFLSIRLQRVISDPIFQLAAVVKSVAEGKNYSLRARPTGRDEFGQLIEGFNDMLNEIQERDLTLQQARLELEERVDERTLELKTEVGERQRAMDHLKDSEARYRAVVEDQTELIIRFKPEGALTFANRAICKYFSQSLDDLLLGGFHDMIFNSDKKRVMKVINALSNEQPTVNLIFRVRCRPGIHRWHQWTFRAITDTAGNVMEYQGVGRDISEQRGTEEKLKMVQQSVEKATSVILWVRSDSSIHYANEAASRQLGAAREDVLRMGFCDIDLQTPVERFKELWNRMRREKSDVFESQFRRADESAIPVEISCSHFEFNGQEFLFMWVADITERTQAEQQLKQAHKEVVESSRLAGMAEVATGVLHNVGNVLNSVNVSASVVEEKVSESKIVNLSKLAELFRRHSDDLADYLTNDPKGEKIPDYIQNLSNHLEGERQTVLQELEVLRKNIDHIKDVVAMQQSYAKVSGVMEAQNVVELVEDALRINVDSLTKSGVQMKREFEEVPLVQMDKHKVLQILVNLIRNANHALQEQGGVDPCITMRVSDNDGMVKIECVDNGCGISSDNLAKIFSHGFTTKEHGHGFGLHSGALAANEMGGSLHVESDGLGKGARFVLQLPISPKRRGSKKVEVLVEATS